MVSINVGRHYVPDVLDESGQPLGIKYKSVTNFIDVLEYKGNLAERDMEFALRGVGLSPDYFLSQIVENIDPDNADERRALKRLGKAAARDAGVWNAAEAGSFVHRMSEMLDSGEATMSELKAAAPDYAQDLEAYARATAHLRHEFIEQRLILDRMRVTGTADRLSTVRGEGLFVADVKTGKSMRYGHLKHSMQFALYAMSQLYDENTGERRDLDIDQDHAIVIHLPLGKGTCDLYAVDLELGRQYIEVAQLVHDARSVRQSEVLTPLPPQTLTAEAIHGMIKQADSRGELTDVWKEASARGEWTEEHTKAAKRQMEEF